MDFFKGILLLLVLVIIGSWMTQADFADKNPGIANFLGFTSSNVKTSNTKAPVNSVKPEVGNSNIQSQSIKIIGASVSFEGEYSRIILRVNNNSRTTNLSQYILKTSSGSYNLPAIILRAGDYVVITSGASADGLVARRISANQYEVFLSQRFLSLGYETAELYNSAGVLVSKYVYGLSSFFQSQLGKKVFLSA